MAQRWRDDGERNFGGNQRPTYWDQNERGRERGGRHSQGQDDRERSYEQFEHRGGREWQQGGEQGGQQGSGRQDWQLGNRDYGGARFSRGMERDFDDMGASEMGASGMGAGSRSNADWSSSGGSRGGSRGSDYDADYGTGRDVPYSHGGQGHRPHGGGGQGGGMSGGMGGGQSSADRHGEQGRYRRHSEGGEQYEQGGARWGQFGGPDEETWGPRSQRGLGAWREQYGSGEGYGRGGGPAGQMDYGHDHYGRDMRGSHRGKGPKGYERSPERLKEDICERLTDAPEVDASEVSISVKEGIVTLEGSVPDRRMKHRAEDIVEACPGVKDVENRLRVAGQGGRDQQQSGQQSGQQGTGSQNRLSGGGSLHH